jgi:hypothetical protein
VHVVRPNAVALRVAVSKRPTNQHLVIAEVPAIDQHASAEGGLLVLGEEVVNIAIEGHHTDRTQGKDVLRPGLGVIERVEVLFRVLVITPDLDTEFPPGVRATRDGLVEVFGGMPQVRGLNRVRLRLREGGDALLTLPAIFSRSSLRLRSTVWFNILSLDSPPEQKFHSST